MPRYVVSSETPINVREVNRPDLPDWEAGQLPVFPGRPSLPPGWERPELPPDWERPSLPPRDEWPPLPPWLEPGPGHPIPPTPSHPWVPIEPGEPGEPDPPPGTIWPPLRPEFPGLPDLTGKTLVLALLFVSRHAPVYRWVVIDHDEAKSFLEKVVAWVKAHWPAGGIAGRPPTRPSPG